MKRVTKICRIVSFIAMMLILAIEIPSLHALSRNIVIWAMRILGILWLYSGVSLDNITIIERVLIALIILCFVLCGIIKLLARKKTKTLQRSSGDNAFEQSLLRYLNHNSNSRCYLISGQWGAGKTHMLREFIDKYYENSEVPVYEVSCIGLTTKKDVTEEISKVIERKDESIWKDILELISNIPIIGELLRKLFKRKYGYLSACKNAIFVFDDFERLISYFPESSKDNYSAISNNQNSEDKHLIISGLGNIVSELSEIEKNQRKQLAKNELDKYLAIIGVINEMVEKYKVIIVCNTDKIGKQFVSDTLKAKLNCIEYKKKTNKNAASSLANDIINSYVIEDKRKHATIRKYINNLEVWKVIQSINVYNLRYFSNIIEAFIVTADLFEDIDLKIEGFMESLLISILVVDITYRNNESWKINTLVHSQVGMNVGFLNDRIKKIWGNNCRWVGYNLAAFWIDNLLPPNDIGVYVDKWEKYPYIGIEKKLLNREFMDISHEDFDMFHVCYIIRENEMYNSSKEEALLELLDICSKKYNVNDENILSYVLDSFGKNLSFYSDVFDKTVFGYLIQKNNGMKSIGESHYSERYNEYVENHFRKN